MVTRSTLALGALAMVAGAVAMAFTWQPGLASVYDDSVSYLVMAQALDPWSRPDAAVAAAFPFQSFPPAFPLALAIVGGAHDWHVAHAFVALCFAASVYLSGLLARDATGSGVTAVATALTVALLPGAWIHVKGILSEFPYLAVSLAALAWHRRVDARGNGRATLAWAGLGALLAAALLTRSIGVALVAAIALAEALRWRRERDRARLRGAALAIAIPLACAALWYALRPAVPAGDNYLNVSSGVLRDALEKGPAWVLGLVLGNVAAIAHAWLHALLIFWTGPLQPRVIIAALVGVLAIVGTVHRLLRREADAFYIAGFVAVLLVWPFPEHMYRLVLPLVPLLLVAAWWSFDGLVRRAARGPGAARHARFAACAAFLPLAACVPAVLFYVAARAGMPEEPVGPYRRADIAEFYRIPAGPYASAVAEREVRTFADMDRIRATTPAQARVMWYLPDYVALLAGRAGARLPDTRDAAALAAEVRSRGADYLYVNAIHLRDEGTGGDDPLAPARLAAAYTETAWERRDARGGLESALLKVDPQKLEAMQRHP
jgi:hypothetical protein